MIARRGIDVAQEWRGEEFAQAWIAADRASDLLVLPMAIAAALIADDRPEALTIVDVGSGPGTFLAVLLDALPSARGIWIDASEAMEREARQRLAVYGDRVDFRVGNMTDVDALQLPTEIDAIVSSRAIHHLDVAGVERLYGDVASHLARGGWFVNLDHVGPADAWDARLRRVRAQFNQRPAPESPHRNQHPLPGLQDHLTGMARAGLNATLAWKAFFTCLMVARRDASPSTDALGPSA